MAKNGRMHLGMKLWGEVCPLCLCGTERGVGEAAD